MSHLRQPVLTSSVASYRLMQYTCDKKTCPCGARCSNVPLSERDAVPEGKDGLRIIWVRRNHHHYAPLQLLTVISCRLEKEDSV